MKNIFDKLRSFFSASVQKLKRKPGVASAVKAPDAPATSKGKMDRFTLVSWACTFLLVIGLLGSTLLYKNSHHAGLSPSAAATSQPSGVDPSQSTTPVSGSGEGNLSSILRKLDLKTIIPERPRYGAVVYRVSRGDAMLTIAENYKIKYETILYVNKDLDDNPHNIKPGMELTIPPVDGLYYEWKDGDSFESVATKFDATADDIINFPGNNIDLTDPQVKPGTLVMVPGGSRELRNWAADLTTETRSNNGGTGTSDFGSNACGGGPVASGFGWPADAHSLSGFGYSPSHLGIDITADTGANIYAAGSGVVTMAQGGYNYGYGNVIQIDHGNGYVTVYAHLSQINVTVCQAVGQGTLIGYAGATGNAFGAHLHFEIRVGGKNINPYDIVQ
jgi:murein DD-endopeptidase MepM/ murein hydrolase activator NlpD